MTEKRYDIIIQDKIDAGVQSGLKGIQSAATGAGKAIDFLKKELASVNGTSLTQMANSMSKVVNAQAKQLAAEAKLITAKQKIEAGSLRAATAQQRLAQATTKAASEQQKYNQQLIKTQMAQQRLARDATRAASAVRRGPNLSQQIDAQMGIGSQTNSRQRAADIAAYGRELDKTAKAAQKMGRDAAATAAQIDRLGDAARVGAIDAATATNTHAAAIDNLRMKYDPLFAAETRHAAALRDIAQAERMGAISTQVANAARMRSAQIMKESIQANVAGARSTRLHAHQIQNLGYQVNDVIVSLASGQRPMTVFMQQGAQIAQIFGPGQGGLTTILKEIVGMVGRFALAIKLPLAGIGLLVGGIFKLRNEARSIYDMKLQDEFGKFAESAEEAAKITVTWGDSLSGALGAISEVVGNTFGPALDMAGNGIMEVFGPAFDGMVAGARWGINKMIGIFTFFADWMENDFKTKFYDAVHNALADPLNDVGVYLDRKLGDWREKMGKERQRAFDPKTEGFQQRTSTKSGMTAAEALSRDYIGEGLDLSRQKAYESARKRNLEDWKSQLKGVRDEAKKLQETLDDLYSDALADQGKRAMTPLQKAAADYDKKITDIVKNTKELTAAQKEQIAVTRDLVIANAANDELYRIYQETLNPLEEIRMEMERLDELRPFADTPQEIEAINRKMKELAKETNEFAQFYEDFASEIGDMMTDSFENIFERGTDGFGDMLDDWRSMFRRMLARLATLALAAPVIVPVVTAAAGALGMDGQAVGSAVGKQLGLSDAASLLSASNGLSLGSLNKPFFAPGSMLGSGIDRIGNMFGIGPSPDFVGPMPYGQGGLSSTFTAGNALGGLGGNFLANMLLGDRGIGASIGGTLGGIAGQALIPIPILGAAIGSFLGNALGGLFGNKKPSDKTQSGTLDLGTGLEVGRSGFTGKKFSQENYDAVTGLMDYARQIALAVGGSTGRAGITVGNRDGMRLEFGDGKVQNFGNDIGALIKGLTKGINERATDGMNKSLATALEKIDFSNVKENFDQIIADINFALAFDKLGEVAEETSELKMAFDELNKQFAEARIQAKRLGLDEQKVVQAREKMLAVMRQTVLNEDRFGIAQQMLGGFNEFLELEKVFRQRMKDYAVIGVDTTLLQRNYQLQVQALIAQNSEASVTLLEQEQERLQNANDLVQQYSRIDATFDDLLYQLRYGEFTPDDPNTNLGNLRALVQEVGAQAVSGDPVAQEKLAGLIPEFVRLSEEVNGSNAVFAQDLAYATDLAENTQTIAQQQLQVQQQLAFTSQQQLQILQQMANGGGLANIQEKYFSGDFTTAGKGDYASTDNANRMLIRARDKGIVTDEQITAMQRAAGFYGTPGAGRAYQFFEDNATANAILTAAVKAAGLDGYASGGLITGGVRGRDSVPIMTMPGEYVLRSRAVQALGVGTVAHMNATGSMPSNDNSNAALDQRIAELSQTMEAYMRLMGAAMQQLINSSERTANATESVSGDKVLTGWG